MLSYKIAELSEDAMKGLREQQQKIDSEASRADKYKKATSLFEAKRPAAAFREVRLRLAAASPAGDACYYCERDRYRDIEHVQPKRHYPHRTFDWSNYVYACVICNQDAKKDKCAVFAGEEDYREFDRSHPIEQEILSGDSVLIDIRSEDPLDFFELDFETGSLVPRETSRRIFTKAAYTRAMFDLDSADLLRIRRNYADFYLERCRKYVAACEAGDALRAERILSDILEMEHPTVIVELRRQASSIPVLADLFAKLPPQIGAWPISRP